MRYQLIKMAHTTLPADLTKIGSLEISNITSNVEAFNVYHKEYCDPTRQVTVDTRHCKRAAVLFPLAFIDDEMQLLVTVRHPAISVYPNEISFPGGTVDECDKDAIETALREAREEVGLKPQDITIIGSFTDMVSTFRRKKGQPEKPVTYIVSVVIGLLHTGFTLERNSAEVDEIIFGSIECMFSSLKKTRHGKTKLPVMKLNNNCEVRMFGFSTFVTIFVCIILDLVPEHCLGNLKGLLVEFIADGNKYFPQHILDFIGNKLSIKHMIGNSRNQILSKI